MTGTAPAAMPPSRRCAARTRSGRPCRSPPVGGRNRCRMHGGAPGSGAPLGNRNALKGGRYTKGAKADRRALRQLMGAAERLIGEMA